MVHFNTKYGTITDAIDKEDGIAVVAILFKVSLDFDHITELIQYTIIKVFHHGPMQGISKMQE